ncbi:MAG TPA: exopolysaccharide biosynthesis polyprenyl glycosylphosphotransferase [Acidimicrobiales bacterium]|jgi:exopolysaccharide biosynthesis polyprenyl glycosylphosphotransferase|nr:exopolysaccharide biosynthesis polyprenyl glycosylphosphotransferase [Acidimicrobiales bacterium]
MRTSSPLHLSQAIADLFVVGATWVAVLMVAGPGQGQLDPRPGLLLAAAASLACVTGLAMAGAYARAASGLRALALARLVRGVPIPAVTVLVLVTPLRVTVSLSRVVAGATWTLVALAVTHSAFDRWLARRRRQGRFLQPMLLVGNSRAAHDLYQHLATRPDTGYRLVGFVADFGTPHEPPLTLDDLGSTADAVKIARSRGACGLLIEQGALPRAQLARLVRAAFGAGLSIQIFGGIANLDHRRVHPVPVAHEPLLHIEPPHHGPIQLVAKRTVDVAIGATALILAAPVLLAAAAAIRLGDRGPALFRQQRVGRDGHLFTVLKFRTMTTDADSRKAQLRAANERDDGPLFKLRDDPRVTTIGRILRRTSIDELPQLFNVLAGHMSLVGPRPALPEEVATFDEELRGRARVRPGITGLWQIEARDNPAFHPYRQLDLFYADNWTPTLDLAILLATVPSVIRHAWKGAMSRRGPSQHHRGGSVQIEVAS